MSRCWAIVGLLVQNHPFPLLLFHFYFNGIVQSVCVECKCVASERQFRKNTHTQTERKRPKSILLFAVSLVPNNSVIIMAETL